MVKAAGPSSTGRPLHVIQPTLRPDRASRRLVDAFAVSHHFLFVAEPIVHGTGSHVAGKDVERHRSVATPSRPFLCSVDQRLANSLTRGIRLDRQHFDVAVRGCREEIDPAGDEDVAAAGAIQLGHEQQGRRVGVAQGCQEGRVVSDVDLPSRSPAGQREGRQATGEPQQVRLVVGSGGSQRNRRGPADRSPPESMLMLTTSVLERNAGLAVPGPELGGAATDLATTEIEMIFRQESIAEPLGVGRAKLAHQNGGADLRGGQPGPASISG